MSTIRKQRNDCLSLHQDIWYKLQTLWLFTASDHLTFVLPEFFMGFCGLLADGLIPKISSLSTSTILRRSFSILAWNWLNTFLFTLANQGNPGAVKEDSLNKPWRPIAAGRITMEETRNVLLAAIPLFGVLCYIYLGGFQETSILVCLTWLYNDLGASDKNFIIRNSVIATAYFFYGKGSLQVATGSFDAALPPNTIAWLFITSSIIFSTMSVQDLKDQAGDRQKGRQTAPLVLGEEASRWSIAIPILAWSVICCRWWHCDLVVTALYVVYGGFIAGRTVYVRGFEADRQTWKLWAVWLMCIYALPLVKQGFLGAIRAK